MLSTGSSRHRPLILPMADVERLHLLTALRHCAGNKTRAAQVLGLSIRGLRLKLKAYGSDADDGTSHHVASVFQAFDVLPSSIAVLDSKGLIISTNRAWKTIAETAGLRTFNTALNYDVECEAASERGCADAKPVLDGLTAVRRGESQHFVYTYEVPIAELIHWCQIDVGATESGGSVVVHTDVSSMEYDLETRMPNRRLFGAQLLYRIAESTREGDDFVCLVISLKDTERAASVFGSGALSEAVREVGRRLSVGTRSKPFVARTGPCEFGILWRASGADKERCVHDIALLFREPILFQNQQLTGIGALVGASSFPKDGVTSQSLVSIARASQVAVPLRS